MTPDEKLLLYAITAALFDNRYTPGHHLDCIENILERIKEKEHSEKGWGKACGYCKGYDEYTECTCSTPTRDE